MMSASNIPEFRIGTISKVGFALAIGALSGYTARAGDTWTGATSQDWNDTSNWGGAYPTGNAAVDIATGNYPIISADSSFTPVDIFVGQGVGITGRVDHTAGTASTGSGNWMFIGEGGGTGTYNLADTSGSGGTFTGFAQGSGSLNAGRLNVGAWSAVASTGTFNMNTSGTLTLDAGGDRGLEIGENNSTGTFNLDNGTVNSTNAIQIGNSATGTLNMSGGSITTNGEFRTGQGTGTGTANQTGGTVSSGSWFVVGRDSGSTGTYNLSGGTVNAATTSGAATMGSFAGASGTVNVSGGTFNVMNNNAFYVGEGGTGTLNVSGSGTVTTANAVDGLRLGVNSGAVGTVNLNGGTISAPLVSQGAGTGTFHFNGGTLKAAADNATFMTGLTSATVKDGGAIIDSNGFNVTIGQVLEHDTGASAIDGGLIKMGTGTLTLSAANTYTGATTVTNGTLSLTGSILSTQIAFTLTDSTFGQFAVENSGFSFSGGVSFSLSGVSGNGAWTLFTGSEFGAGDLTPAMVTSNYGSFSNAGGNVWTLSAGGRDWTFNANQGTLSAVPEPGDYTAMIIAFFGIVFVLRRRRQPT